MNVFVFLAVLVDIPLEEIWSWFGIAIWTGVLAWLFSLVSKTSRNISARFFKFIWKWTLGNLFKMGSNLLALEAAFLKQDDLAKDISRIKEEVSLSLGIAKQRFNSEPVIGFWCEAENFSNIEVTDLYRYIVEGGETQQMQGKSWEHVIHPDDIDHYRRSVSDQRGSVEDLKNGITPPNVSYKNVRLLTINGESAGTYDMSMQPVPYDNGSRKFIYIGSLTPSDTETLKYVNSICDEYNITRIQIPTRLIDKIQIKHVCDHE